jgi:heat-inducible transcriptional repressor
MLGQELSDRKKLILKSIIESHIECGEPVGSKSLMQLPGINCSSATIRNEMAELEEMGYLEQPHTSAGRVPSQLGYRFYVDQLIEHYRLTSGEIDQINRILASKSAELDQILLSASRIASAMTNYTGIALQPKHSEVTVTRFESAFIDERNFVLIMIMSLGRVASKHIRLSEPRGQETINRLVAALNANLTGVTADRINLPVMVELENAMGSDSQMIGPIMKTVYATLNEYDGGQLQYSGINRLLQYSDYDDPDELSGLLGTLEQKDEILKLVSDTKSDEVSVLIGSESPVKVMENSSLVFKPVMKDGRVLGVIGVLGPRRMDYAKVLETIEQLCGSVSELMDSIQPPGMGLPEPADAPGRTPETAGPGPDERQTRE